MYVVSWIILVPKMAKVNFLPSYNVIISINLNLPDMRCLLETLEDNQ